MNSNPVEELIRKYGNDDSVVFVFPSDIAASLWLEAALAITARETLPSRRFIAWDRFKEQAVQATVAGRSPVSSLLRKLYALNLAKRNSEASPNLFSSLIPQKYAADGTVFAAWIARLLPELSLCEQKAEKASAAKKYRMDKEDADLSFLKEDYNHFLDAHCLFEPSWQRPPLKDTGDSFIIFFPEAIEDFREYRSLLSDAQFITQVSAPVPSDGEEPAVAVYENTREELSTVALEVEELLRSGVSPEEIAVSVPDLETIEPYLLREFSLRGIPVEYRAGHPLGNLPAGRLFSLISGCVSSGFAFSSFKALLLDRLVPWKHRNLAEHLVSFGIRNHCVTSWKDSGKTLDVWEEAFKTPTRGEEGDWRLRDWYRELRNSLSQITGAKTFTDIRNRYFAFREKFLDMDQLAPEDDAVIARCIEELNALASLEKPFAPYIPENPYAFFASVLDEKKYVPQRLHGGVSVFPYRVAAGTPFPHHFILDASQDQATVLYRQLTFLRQDKRQTLGLDEVDASADFFNIYRCCARGQEPSGNAGKRRVRFSFSAQTFSGYRTPHGYFNAQIKADVSINDPFAAERNWLAQAAREAISAEAHTENEKNDSDGPASARSDRLYPVQKTGFSAWKSRNLPRVFSYLQTAFGNRNPDVSARIIKKKMTEGELLVTQTDLASFSVCPARWFLDNILSITEESYDAELMNERNLGILYHDVLQTVYERIRSTDKVFTAAKLDLYRSWAAEAAASSAANHDEFAGPLVAPLIDSLVDRIAEGAAGIIERDAEVLDGFAPAFLEGSLVFSDKGIRYYGRVDRISIRPSDQVAVLIDYKSANTKKPADYKTDGTKPIDDFQIPMYIYLAENSANSPCKGSRLEHAWFGNIKDKKYRPIVNDDAEVSNCGTRGSVSREEFTPAMDSFKTMTGLFAESVKRQDFTRPARLAWTECTACAFRKICRYTYSVRP